MKRNLANWDRWARVLGGAGLMVGAFFAPVSMELRLGVLGAGGIYMLATALTGTCLGYRLLGRSTCPVSHPS